MKTRFTLPLAALILSQAVPAVAQDAQDFSLPPAPAPSSTQRAQGPVDDDGIAPLRPRVIATATPTPTATQAPPTAASPAPTQAPATNPVTARPSAAPARQTIQAADPAVARPTPIERGPVVPEVFPPVPAEIGAQPPGSATPATAAESTLSEPSVEADTALTSDWRILAGIGTVLALLLAGFVFWRRRKASVIAPEIERPRVAAPEDNAPAPAIPATTEALTIRCEAEKLTRSAVFATLKYRLTLVNRTDMALNDVTIGIDLVSAHASAPMEDQVATPATTLETRHTLPRIAPRQNIAVEGQVQLPLASAQVIFQGRHPLLVPLMRVRIDGAGEGALVKTFVVGQGVPNGGRVQPFRLDEPPRSYAPIAQRELA